MRIYRIWRAKDKLDHRPPSVAWEHKTTKAKMSAFTEFMESLPTNPLKSGDSYWIHEEGSLTYHRVDVEEQDNELHKYWDFSVKLPPHIDADIRPPDPNKWGRRNKRTTAKLKT